MTEIHTGGARNMSADVQTASSTLPPSLIRTLIPVLAGLVGTWLVNTFAVELDTATAGALVTAGISYTYYALARFLEVYGSDRWGYILGFRKLPAYVSLPLPSATAVVDSGRQVDDRGATSLGSLAIPLLVIGTIMIVLAVTVVASQVLLILGIVAVVVGIAMLLTGRS